MITAPASEIADQLESKFPSSMQDVPQEHRLAKRDDEQAYLINGKLKQWTGCSAEVSSPICFSEGEGWKRAIIGHVPSMDDETVMSGLEAAVKAWDHGRSKWATMDVAGRIAAVENFLDGMVKVRDDVVRLLMWEIGKTLDDSRKEFDRTVEYIQRTIEALKETDRSSSRFVLDGGVIAQVRRTPLGVSLSMGPFNYPLNELYTTLIPALIMGNTVVVKPPKFGVLLHQPLLKAFADSFPPGVVNFVYGQGARIISPLMRTGLIDVLAFIGSSRVADILKQQHPRPHRMRSVLSLDAKNAALVMPDADIDITVKECLTGSLSYNGQRCTALKIIFVHKSIVHQFLEKFCTAVDALPIGMPWEKGVRLTPLPEFGKAEKLNLDILDALANGARVINPRGGESFETLYRPAVVYPIMPEATLYTKEQFGPVVPVCAYEDEKEFMDFISLSNYGQQVSIFGRDVVKMAKLIDHLSNQVCRINLNCQCQRGPDTLPFAGRKDSAEATLSISDALRCFSIRSLVAAQSTAESRQIIQSIVTGRYSNFLHTDFIF